MKMAGRSRSQRRGVSLAVNLGLVIDGKYRLFWSRQSMGWRRKSLPEIAIPLPLTTFGRQYLQLCSGGPQTARKVLRNRHGNGSSPFRQSLCSIEGTIPPSRPAFPGARRRVAVKDGRRPPRSVLEGQLAALRRLWRGGPASRFRFPQSLQAIGKRKWEAPQKA